MWNVTFKAFNSVCDSEVVLLHLYCVSERYRGLQGLVPSKILRTIPQKLGSWSHMGEASWYMLFSFSSW